MTLSVPAPKSKSPFFFADASVFDHRGLQRLWFAAKIEHRDMKNDDTQSAVLRFAVGLIRLDA